MVFNRGSEQGNNQNLVRTSLEALANEGRFDFAIGQGRAFADRAALNAAMQDPYTFMQTIVDVHNPRVQQNPNTYLHIETLMVLERLRKAGWNNTAYIQLNQVQTEQALRELFPLEATLPYNSNLQYNYAHGLYIEDRPIAAERAALFASNRSETLSNDPNATLDPQRELLAYFDKQSPEYVGMVKNLAEQIPEAMDSTVRAVVCIPVAGHEEGKHIYQTLENYSYQTASNDQYELLLFVNHPEGTTQDETLVEIGRFKIDYPEMPIRVIYKEIPKADAKMAYIRKVLTDVALYRHLQRGQQDQDLILISNDADLKGVAPEYVANFITKFDNNPQMDVLVGQIDWDPESYIEYPGIHAGTRLFQYLNLQIFHSRPGDTPSSGANTAFKGSIYAGVGGYQLNDQQGAEDVILGQAIRAGRGGSKTLGYAGSRVSRIYTSSRRAIDVWKKGLAPIQQWDRNWGVRKPGS